MTTPPSLPRAEERGGLGPPSILVVDDRRANRLALVEILRSEERLIVTASSGLEALRILMDHDFSVILLDVNMPGMDGFEVARMIRERPRTAHTPIIFVTAISMEAAAIQRGYELGAVDYIFSPIVPAILQAKVAVFINLHTNTKHLEASLREREASEARYRALFHDSPVPLWEFDLSGALGWLGTLRAVGAADLRQYFEQVPEQLGEFVRRVSLRDVNRAALEMCESDSAARLRAELGHLFGDNEPGMLEELFAALEAGRETTETEAVLRTLRGGTKHVSVRVSALPGYQPPWSRVVVSSTDIAELHRQRAELERSNRELQQFAYVASHDLRAPLRAIDALSQWLAQDLQSVFDDNQRAQMELLRGRVRRMDRLLADLLDYARAGGEAVDVESVDLGAVLAEVIELCSVPAGFEVVAASRLPVLETARLPLRRVLLNLIGNAIKHHDQPSGTVEVSVTPTEEHVTVRVADDGPGIPPAFRERVFQMFQTLKPRDAVEGSGMGLALVRKLVESVGGKVWVESNGGRGAVVAFDWPRRWPRRPRRQTPSTGLRRVTPIAGLENGVGR